MSSELTVEQAGILRGDNLRLKLKIGIILQDINGTKLQIAMRNDQTIEELRQVASEKLKSELESKGYTVKELNLILVKDGQILQDGKLLCDYDLKHNSIVAFGINSTVQFVSFQFVSKQFVGIAENKNAQQDNV
jgi:hypothetical protein